MKYIKRFENINENDNYKNKILLIDSSGSFQQELRTILEKELYLTNKFTVIFASYNIAIFKNIDLDKLEDLIDKYKSFGGDGMQNGIDNIITQKLEGAVLIFSDGVFEINISELPNDISVIYTELKPKVTGGECEIFHNEIDTRYYTPRDCKSLEEYEARKMAKKYNI